MTSRLYTCLSNAVAVTAQQDFLEIVSASTKVTYLHRLSISQSTEVGDAMEEGLNILIKSGSTTTGSGGSTITPVPLALGDPAYGGTVKANNTTKATAGTIVSHYGWNWNVRLPFEYIWTPEERKCIAPSARLTVELATTPADSITLTVFAVIEEAG